MILAMAIHVVMADVRADSSGIGDAGMAVDDEGVYLLHLPYHVVSAIPTYIENAGLGAGTNYLGSPVTIITDMVFEFLALVATSVIYIVHHIVELGLGLLGGLSTAIADTVQGAIDAVVESLSILVDFIIQTVLFICSGFMESVLLPLSQMWMGYCQGIAYAMSLMLADYESLGYVTIESMRALTQAFQGDFFWLAFGLATIITAVTLALTVMTSVAGFIVSIALSIAAGFIIQGIFSATVPDGSDALVNIVSGNMDMDDVNQSLAVLEGMGVAPESTDSSTEANKWRVGFAAGAIGAGLIGAFMGFLSLCQEDSALNALGIIGIIVSVISVSLVLYSLIETDLVAEVVFLGFWTGLLGIGASVLGAKYSAGLAQNLCIFSAILGGASFIMSWGSMQYQA
ncbi:MAG: hypothetical protein PHW93_02420 [Candidatus Methanomethylophilaceae archaeon]|nr:hypothetical protein [Candidatus Methanomethylophilaceae archaeon]